MACWVYMPIMHDKEITVLPFAMFVPHEEQAIRNHSQSLAELARRGGLALSEAVAILEDREWRSMSDDEARARIRAQSNREK